MGNNVRQKHIKYNEGQWFLVPLNTSGYTLGIIVRGSYKTKGGLGYFFNHWLADMPDNLDVRSIDPSDVILIAWFGDLGIISGRWPLIKTVGTFNKNDWRVPSFGRIDAVDPSHGWMIEYEQENPTFALPLREIRRKATEVADLPKESLYGALALEYKLTPLVQGPL